MKKWLSLALCLLMMLGSVNTVYAEQTKNWTGTVALGSKSFQFSIQLVFPDEASAVHYNYLSIGSVSASGEILEVDINNTNPNVHSVRGYWTELMMGECTGTFESDHIRICGDCNAYMIIKRETKLNDHDWEDWRQNYDQETYSRSCKVSFCTGLERCCSYTANNNGTHTRNCKAGVHTATENCSGGTATCTDRAKCSKCSAAYGTTNSNAHDILSHDGKAATCTEDGWAVYDTCKRAGCNYSTYKAIPALNHDLEHHAAKAATCTEIGWNAYDTCKRAGCNYSTYKAIPALKHDLEHHAAQAVTCEEIGWDAYDTCKRAGCEYTTYQEIPALGHDLEHHAAKEPACGEIGWYSYDTCKREGCEYTTYQEKSEIGHWLDLWTPDEEATHVANCMREGCDCVGKTECEFWTVTIGEELIEICPVCGRFGDEAFEAITDATIEGENLPIGETLVRGMKAPFDGALFAFTAGCEYSGKMQEFADVASVKLPIDDEEIVEFRLVRVDVTEENGERIENWTEIEFTFEENVLAFETDAAGLFLILPIE